MLKGKNRWYFVLIMSSCRGSFSILIWIMHLWIWGDTIGSVIYLFLESIGKVGLLTEEVVGLFRIDFVKIRLVPDVFCSVRIRFVVDPLLNQITAIYSRSRHARIFRISVHPAHKFHSPASEGNLQTQNVCILGHWRSKPIGIFRYYIVEQTGNEICRWNFFLTCHLSLSFHFFSFWEGVSLNCPMFPGYT